MLCFTAFIKHHDDVIKWKHFPRNWPFVRGIHRSPVNTPHKGQWRGALMFTLICDRINGWVNTREAGDLRRYRPHYDVIVMCIYQTCYGLPIVKSFQYRRNKRNLKIQVILIDKNFLQQNIWNRCPFQMIDDSFIWLWFRNSLFRIHFANWKVFQNSWQMYHSNT